LATEIATARRHHTSLLVLALDIDDFKLVNDARGHQDGDRVLRTLADALRALRTGDIAGRLGGDEFAVILASTTPAEARSVAARLLTELSAAGVHVSIGLAALAASHDAAGLLSLADSRLFHAKRDGKRRLVDAG
jgi:diguanylate cyclase (GGDEF)-like protein